MTKSEKLSKINNNLIVAIAEEKAKKAAAESEYYATVHRLQKGAQEMREAVYNEPDEQEEPQGQDEPQEQPTVWLDGSQHSAVIVARRVLRKLPRLNYKKETISISLTPSYFGGCSLEIKYINTIDKFEGYKSCTLYATKDTPEEQSEKIDQWLKDVEVQMERAEEIMRKEADNE